MNAKSTMKRKHLVKGKTDWKRIKTMTEKEIQKAAKSDPDAPPLTASELKQFKRVNPPRRINVKAIRNKLELTQEEFAFYFGVNKRTVQEWEQNRRTPTATARNFLRVIEREPRAVQRALTKTKRKAA